MNSDPGQGLGRHRHRSFKVTSSQTRARFRDKGERDEEDENISETHLVLLYSPPSLVSCFEAQQSEIEARERVREEI